MRTKNKTYGQLVETAIHNGMDALDAELIVTHSAGFSAREKLLSHWNDPIRWNARERFACYRALQKRKHGVPVAYITGTKEFYGLEFFVNKHTLIPRPDTEMLVESALASLHTSQKSVCLIDIGTGTGCIPISIAKTTPKKDITLIASDISKKALCVAKKNAMFHHVPITFLHGNLLVALLKKDHLLKNIKEVIITANLPYLTLAQFQQEASIQHEPKRALVAKNNGLALYETIFKQIKTLLGEQKKPLTVFCEIDPTQSGAMISLIKEYLPHAKTNIQQDLARKDRLVIFTI